MYERMEVVGNVGGDPAASNTQRGEPVWNFSLAVNKTYKNDQGVKTTVTKWFRVSCFGDRWSGVMPYLKKGGMVLVTGTISASTFTDKNHQIQVSLNITADELRLLGSPRSEEGQSSPNGHPAEQSAEIPF